MPTAINAPSALTSSDVGYQPVGINPSSEADDAVPLLTSYCATALMPPSATKSVRPSGARATAVGASPILRSWNGATVMVPRCRAVRVSTTEMSSELPLDT